MRLKVILSFLCFSICNFLNSQITFTNDSGLLENQDLSGGFAMGVADMNGDGLDDIIRFHNASQLELEYQQTDGSFTKFTIGQLHDGDVWSVCVGDIDRNGLNDLVTGGFYESLPIVKTMGEENFDLDLLDGPLIFLQGSNIVDINNDGNLDYFGCHDDGISSPYMGDGNNLVYDSLLMPAPGYEMWDFDSNSGNYASTWVDYDNDGDLDLYISKCRIGSSDPMNPNRVNLMYRNDGGGVFTEVAGDIGLRPYGQSWSTEFGDIDNDGDLDALVMNHDIPSSLYENDGSGNFTNISLQAGIDISTLNFLNAMQSYMQDFDNDGFLDIMVTSYSSFPRIYHNNGDKTFTEVVSPWGTDINTVTSNTLQSAAMGDLNNDGFVDMIAGFANGINLPNGSFRDRLYTGVPNGNNWVKVNLDGMGIVSNINGIGARIEIHGPWGTQIRDIRSGHSYGIMNSLSAMFGIGDATEIDSIIVKWPSGIISTLENPSINSSIDILESSLSVEYASEQICEGESILLGGQLQTTAGTYTDTLDANTILITSLTVYENYDIEAMPITACYNAIVQFGEETLSQPGDYVFEYASAEGCDSTVSVNFSWFDEIIIDADIVDDWGPGTGMITIDITGAVEPYDIFWSTGETNVTSISDLDHGETYLVEILDANGCTQTMEFDILLSSLNDLKEEGINVFPNPATEKLFIDNQLGLASSISLYNTIGQEVFSGKIVSGINTIDLNMLTDGLYIVRLKDKDQKDIGTLQIVKD